MHSIIGENCVGSYQELGQCIYLHCQVRLEYDYYIQIYFSGSPISHNRLLISSSAYYIRNEWRSAAGIKIYVEQYSNLYPMY
jgi:hypothetical protein